MKKQIFIFFFFLFFTTLHAKEVSKWMPHGVSIDPSGNIIYAVPFPKMDSWALSSGLTLKPKLSAKAGGNIQVINLSKEENVFYSDVEEFESGVPPNDGSGFLVINKYSGNLSFGPGLSKSLSSLWVGVSLTVTPGSSYTVVRHVNRYEEASKLPLFKSIPTTFKDFQKMKESDSLTYSTSGSIAFNLSTGKSMVHAGFTYLAKGSWVTTVKKVSPVHVLAQYKTSKLTQLKLSAGASYGSVSLDQFKKASDALTYQFNLQNPSGLLAYQAFLKGDLTKARDLYLKTKVVQAFKKGRTSPVAIIKDIDTLEVGKGQSAGINIPYFIGANYKNQKNFIMQNTQQINKGTLGKNYIGVYKELSKTTGFLSSHSHRLLMFMGKWQTLTNLSPPGQKDTHQNRFSANFKYEFHMDNMEYTDIIDELEYLSRRIGQRERLFSLNQSFPDSHKGFLQITADLMISMEAIEGLMKWGTSSNLRGLEKRVLQSINSWYKNPENTGFNLCNWKGPSDCQQSLLDEGQKAIKDMGVSLQKMRQAQKKSIETFVEALTNLGKGFSANQFTFEETHKVLKKYGDTHLIIQWKGEKVPQGESVLFKGKTPFVGLIAGEGDKARKRQKKVDQLIQKVQKVIRKKRKVSQ